MEQLDDVLLGLQNQVRWGSQNITQTFITYREIPVFDQDLNLME